MLAVMFCDVVVQTNSSITSYCYMWALYGVANNMKSCMTAKLYSADVTQLTDVYTIKMYKKAIFVIACCQHHCRWLTCRCDMHNRIVPSLLQQWPLAQLTKQSIWSHSRCATGTVELEQQRSASTPCSCMPATPEMAVNAAGNMKISCATTWGCDIKTKHQVCKQQWSL